MNLFARQERPRVRSTLSAAAVVVWSVWLFPVAAQGSADRFGTLAGHK